LKIKDINNQNAMDKYKVEQYTNYKPITDSVPNPGSDADKNAKKEEKDDKASLAKSFIKATNLDKSHNDESTHAKLAVAHKAQPIAPISTPTAVPAPAAATPQPSLAKMHAHSHAADRLVSMLKTSEQYENKKVQAALFKQKQATDKAEADKKTAEKALAEEHAKRQAAELVETQRKQAEE
jgi:hypothetical protein